MRTFDDMLSRQLKDKEFKKEYDAIQPEMDVIKAIVDARISQNLTQKELAKRTGINQADISKLENIKQNSNVINNIFFDFINYIIMKFRKNKNILIKIVNYIK